jgi:nicotinate (nicotinamide) nucleotide adenylyltransferase
MYAKREEIVIFGGSFNPPGIHHEIIAESIITKLKWVDRLIIYPCGHRPEKETTNNIAPFHRGEMSRLAFLPMEKTSVVLYDIQNNVFTRTHELQKKYQELGRVWHAVGTDWIKGGSIGQSLIQRHFKMGELIWREYNILVLKRAEHGINKKDLPPNNRVLELNIKGSSTNIREKTQRGESVTGLVSPKVEGYILQNQLYLKEKIDEKHDFYREKRGAIERDCWLEL